MNCLNCNKTNKTKNKCCSTFCLNEFRSKVNIKYWKENKASIKQKTIQRQNEWRESEDYVRYSNNKWLKILKNRKYQNNFA